MDSLRLLKSATYSRHATYFNQRSTPPTIWVISALLILYCLYVVMKCRAFDGETTTIESVWLRPFVVDEEFAEKVQSTLSDSRAERLAFAISRRVNDLSCRTPVLDNATKTSIYVVTPTYRRPEQIAELTRLAQTLTLVPNICWMVCEDALEKSPLIAELLERRRFPTVHLFGGPKTDEGGYTTGAVNCRNLAITWIRENATEDGVLYMADDDNSYDIDLFEEIRSTKRVSMFPIGFGSELGISTPIVKYGKFVGFYDAWLAPRKFPVDTGSFAVNIKFLKERPNARMGYGIGHEEDTFLRSLAPFEPEELELKADNCTKILVWHTQSVDYGQAKPLDQDKYADTNIIKLNQFLR